MPNDCSFISSPAWGYFTRFAVQALPRVRQGLTPIARDATISTTWRMPSPPARRREITMRSALILLVVAAGSCFADSVADAAMRGDAAAVRSLIQKGDVNGTLPDGTTALHWTVRADDLETARMLLSAGANAKAVDHYGVTPLYLACVNGNPAMIRALLDAGADANSADPTGETALMTAARTGNPDAVLALIQHKATVNAADKDSETALMWAVRENHPEAVRVLLEHGADVNARTRIVENPPAATGNLQGIGRAQNLPKGVTPGGLTPLHYAAREGTFEIAKMLVAAGAAVNTAEANGTTPLVVAILNNHLDVARFLLEHGANPNSVDGFGRAPLWAAVDLRNMDLDNKTGENGVDRAPALELIRTLLDLGANPNAQLSAEPPSRRWMLPFGASQWVSPVGQTPFVRAALSGDVAVMRLLLAKGADPKIATAAGATALLAAAGVGYVPTQSYIESKESMLEAVKLCAELGLDVNAVTVTGVSAAHGAAYRGADEIIEFLASKGARLDLKDNQGRTPTTYAEGVYLGGKPPEPRPKTIAMIQRLKGE
jgi:uncharacterized protein